MFYIISLMVLFVRTAYKSGNTDKDYAESFKCLNEVVEAEMLKSIAASKYWPAYIVALIGISAVYIPVLMVRTTILEIDAYLDYRFA